MATAWPTMDHTHTAMENPLRKYFTLGYDVGIGKILEEMIPGLHEVRNLEECDFIFLTWSSGGGSQARNDTEAAVKILNALPGDKPALLVVLHDPNGVVPDGSGAATRKNTLTVSFLYQEYQELFHFPKNQEALLKIMQWLTPEGALERTPTSATPGQALTQTRELPIKKYYTLTVGSTLLKHGARIHAWLQKSMPSLQEAPDSEACDFILVLCSPDVPVKMLNTLSGNKPAVVMLLHPLDPEVNLPTSTTLNRANTIAVRCWLHEELEQCSANQTSLGIMIAWLYSEKNRKREPQKMGNSFQANIPTVMRPIKHFTLPTGKTLGQDVNIERKLQHGTPGLQKVNVVDECDFVLALCPVVSRVGTDIQAAEKKLNAQRGNKPAVLMVLHHTFDPDYIVAESRRIVTCENTIAVDCLFHEDEGLLQCRKNNQAFAFISDWIKTHVRAKNNKRPF